MTLNRITNNVTTSASRVVRLVLNPPAANPIFTGTLLTMLQFIIVVPPLIDVQKTVTVASAILALSFIAANAVTIFFSLWLVSRGVDRSPTRATRLLAFYAGLLVFALLDSLVLSLFATRVFPHFISIVMRIYVATVIFQIATGFFQARYQDQIDSKEALVEELSTQRGQLLQADEQTRESVALFLHNTVQSTLVVLSTQLNDIAQLSNSKESSQIKSIVEELERVRAIDVRQASRLLTPLTVGLTLEQILQPLIDYYSSDLLVDWNIIDLSEAETARVALPIYRVTEQALLNARIHAKATHVAVGLSISDRNDYLILTVENNGTAPIDADGRRLGVGLTVTETWISQFGGTWSLTTQGEGAILKASFTRE